MLSSSFLCSGGAKRSDPIPLVPRYKNTHRGFRSGDYNPHGLAVWVDARICDTDDGGDRGDRMVGGLDFDRCSRGKTLARVLNSGDSYCENSLYVSKSRCNQCHHHIFETCQGGAGMLCHRGANMKQEVVLYNVMKRSGHVTDCHKGKIGCNFTDEWQSSFFATKSSKILTIEGSQNTKAKVKSIRVTHNGSIKRSARRM
jgi:hypothetical protein